MTSVRKFAFTIGGLAAFQLVVYCLWTFGGFEQLLYFDPRIGIAASLEFLGFRQHGPSIFSWASLIWQAIVAFGVARRPSYLRSYLVGEALLSIPTLFFFGVVISSNMSSHHGFSIRELTIPAIVFFVFSLIPFFIAIALQRSDDSNSVQSAGA
jgi:hypothetical protein